MKMVDKYRLPSGVIIGLNNIIPWLNMSKSRNGLMILHAAIGPLQTSQLFQVEFDSPPPPHPRSRSIRRCPSNFSS